MVLTSKILEFRLWAELAGGTSSQPNSYQGDALKADNSSQKEFDTPPTWNNQLLSWYDHVPTRWA